MTGQKNKKNQLTMDQPMNVILTIDNVHTSPQNVLDCIPYLCGLNQVYGPNHPTPSVRNIGKCYYYYYYYYKYWLLNSIKLY